MEKGKLKAKKKTAELEVQDLVQRKHKTADLQSDILLRKEMAKQKKEISDTLLKDAGECLKKAVEEKDFLNIDQAQRVLKAALKVRSEE